MHGLIEVNTTNIPGIDEDAIKYVYATIPKEYLLIYHKILILLADYGEDMLKDCKAACKDRNKDIVECYMLFNAAVAAKKLRKTTEANTLITYLEATLDVIYKETPDTSFTFNVDDDGILKAVVTNDDDIELYINPEDGNLYKTYVESCYNNGYVLVGDNNEFLDLQN